MQQPLLILEQPQTVKVPCNSPRVRKPACVPRSQEHIELFQHVNQVPKSQGPFVEVLLIAELTVLDPGKTPLEASFLPPQPHWLAGGPHEGHELDTVLAADRGLVVLGVV